MHASYPALAVKCVLLALWSSTALLSPLLSLLRLSSHLFRIPTFLSFRTWPVGVLSRAISRFATNVGATQLRGTPPFSMA